VRFALVALLGFTFGPAILGQTVPLVSFAGQPFSADEVIERNAAPNVRNVLPMQTTRVYRDSAGRTRTDVPVPTSPAYSPVVSIYDPVLGVQYSLDAKARVAHRFFIPGPPPGQFSTPRPLAAALVSSVYCKFGPPCPVTMSESLGTQVIDGIAAEGTRATSTSPATFRQAAWKSLIESWRSPELGIILLEKESHVPNTLWDSTTRLENINRAEPDPLLFRIPSDYTVVDQAASQ
jgi:hypothetical protein